MKLPMCPVSGCDELVKVHGMDKEENNYIFTCPVHGSRMRLSASGDPKLIERIRPPMEKSPFHPLASHDLLYYYTYRAGRTKGKVKAGLLKKIARRFVKEFKDEQLAFSWTAKHKINVVKQFRKWFKGHYYEHCITSTLFNQTLSELGLKSDTTGRYWLNTCFKGE